MYGVYGIVVVSSGWLFSSRFLGGGSESVFFTSYFERPFAVKTSMNTGT